MSENIKNISRKRMVSRRSGSKQRVDNKARKNRNIEEAQEKPKKKMVGIFFYILLFIIIISEIIVVILNLTAVLAPVTIIVNVFITSIIIIYLFVEGVSIFTTRKLALSITMLTIELIPLLNALPGFTLGFILTRVFENNDLIKEVAAIKKGRIDKVK